jgi:hypothetical protein
VPRGFAYLSFQRCTWLPKALEREIGQSMRASPEQEKNEEFGANSMAFLACSNRDDPKAKNRVFYKLPFGRGCPDTA